MSEIEYLGKDVRLIISEIDGVITTGERPEDEMGHILYKVYQSKDFSAINELKKNFKFVFLSDDNHVNYNMCKRKNIPFFWARNGKEKYDKLVDILRRYGCTPDETIYIGSKISDVRCCQMMPKSFCPEDAGHYLKEICWAEFVTRGGFGIMPELLYLLTKSGQIS
jgi:3-deoxy-D-manno-octulosonate 8-phosphate phosphatase KdsC-like HAD superfamily phosphatase